MNILFYTPFNQRSRDTETLMQAFIGQGHHVLLLTQAEKGTYHEACEKLGVKVFDHVIPKKNSLIYFIKQALYFIRFCKNNNIDLVYAHLETAALPAVLGQYSIKSKVIVCRHIINEAFLFNNKNFIRMNKIVYKLARQIIVVSQHAKDFMVSKEGVSAHKIKVIHLAYNFDLYAKPDPREIEKIKKDHQSHLLLITACRLVPSKRADQSIRIIKKLTEKGLDVSLLILGHGPESENLQKLIDEEKLNSRVFLLGYKTNMVDYLHACDLLIHPSILDASSVIIKEAGLAGKTVVACRDIGDVNEYLTNGKNAFLVSENNTEVEMAGVISDIYNHKEQLNQMGNLLKEIVTERFSIKNILPQYEEIHRSVISDL